MNNTRLSLNMFKYSIICIVLIGLVVYLRNYQPQTSDIARIYYFEIVQTLGIIILILTIIGNYFSMKIIRAKEYNGFMTITAIYGNCLIFSILITLLLLQILAYITMVNHMPKHFGY